MAKPSYYFVSFLILALGVMTYGALTEGVVQEAMVLHGSFTPEEVNDSIKEIYTINGYNIVVADLSGESVGYTYDDIKDTIFIEKELNIYETKDICEHELLHARGVEEKNHDFIYANQDKIDSKTCERLIYEIGRHDAEAK